MQMQTNNNSGKVANSSIATSSVSIEIDKFSFLGDLLNDKDGLIKTKNLLNEVFTTFFVSDNFCNREESQRCDYTCLLDNLQDWVDVCHAEFVARKAEAEADKQIEALEAMRQNIINKKTARG